MKRHIFICSTAILTTLIWSSWTSVTEAQYSSSSSRRAEWQQRVLGDSNPANMTPEVAFGDQPLLTQREYNLDPVPEGGTIEEVPGVLSTVPQGNISGDCGCGGGGLSGGCSDCGSDCGCECPECGPMCGDPCSCDACCNSCNPCYDPMRCGLLSPGMLNPILRRTQFFGGVHSFKGPIDQGSNGNFGFHGGFNLGAPLGGLGYTGYQLGMNVVGSDYHGSTVLGDDSGDRKQLFFTGGLFHRALNGGLQGGAVYDFLQDSFYFGRANVGQLRGELSWSHCGYHELGFWGSFRARDGEVTQTVGQQTLLWEVRPTNLYAFFYRRNFDEGAEARLWGGFTNKSAGIVGADMRIPLRKGIALENNFNYLIPKEGRGDAGTTEESWSISINLVWYPGRSAKGVSCDPFRPLFGVGDNSTFMTDLR